MEYKPECIMEAFNNIIMTNKMPNDWRKSRMLPIFKGDLVLCETAKAAVDREREREEREREGERDRERERDREGGGENRRYDDTNSKDMG